MNLYLALKDNLEKIFLSDKKLQERRVLRKKNIEIIYEKYLGFFTLSIGSVVRLFYIPEKCRYMAHKDFINVTKNKRYRLKNILNGSIVRTGIVIEGADGTGKSTLVGELAQRGFLCQDRAVKEITCSMREEILKEERIKNVKKYLEQNSNKIVVFLYLSNENVLKDRIFSRGELSEFDKKAIIFQRMYVETYNSLKDFQNLFIVDCIDKTPKQIANEIIKLMG